MKFQFVVVELFAHEPDPRPLISTSFCDEKIFDKICELNYSV